MYSVYVCMCVCCECVLRMCAYAELCATCVCGVCICVQKRKRDKTITYFEVYVLIHHSVRMHVRGVHVYICSAETSLSS